MCGPSPPTMSPRLEFLIRLLKEKRRQKEPYVLLLGSGASLSSGCSSTRAIINDIFPNEGLVEIDDVWCSLGDDEKCCLLEPHLSTTKPSFGYQLLAELIKAGYFDTVFTTNFDPILEDSLADAGLRARDYLVLINDRSSTVQEEIARQLDFSTPRIKIVKLHGDLYRRHLVFAESETFQFSKPLEDALNRFFKRSLLIVGHSMRDTDVNRCIESTGGSIWYVNPSPPEGEVLRAMKARSCPKHYIDSEEGNFDVFFALAHHVLVKKRHTAWSTQPGQEIIAVENQQLLRTFPLAFKPETVTHLFVQTIRRVENLELLRVPVVGTIGASFCHLHYPSDGITLYLPKHLVKEDCRAFKVVGDSMIANGIHDGDYVLVVPRAKVDPINGQTWAVVVSTETDQGYEMIKKIYMRDDENSVELEAANKAFDSLSIAARCIPPMIA
jgi:SOS-response transcriptional repressor LexA